MDDKRQKYIVCVELLNDIMSERISTPSVYTIQREDPNTTTHPKTLLLQACFRFLVSFT